MRRGAQVALAVLFLLIVVELVVFAPNTLDVREKAISPTDQVASGEFEQMMQGIHLVQASKDFKEWELWADKAISYKQQQTWHLTKVKIKFFTEKGDHYFVEGDKGTVNNTSHDIFVEGNIKITSMSGFIFLVDTLKYNSLQKLMTSPDEVRVMGPLNSWGRSLYLTGKGLEGDLKISLMTILDRVRAEKTYRNGEKLVKIRSKIAKFDGNGQVANFLQKVVIDSDTMRITGEVAGVIIDPKGKSVKTVQVEGGVRVTDTDKWATAHQLIAYFDEKKFVFKGSPRVVQDSDELRGDEIIFLDGGKKVKIKRAKVRLAKPETETLN